MSRSVNPNLWFRILKRKHQDHWEQVFASIDNEALRIKVACLVFWDCYWQDDDDDWSIHKQLIGQYKRHMEDEYKEDELIATLHWIGYPLEIALERAKTPKCCNI